MGDGHDEFPPLASEGLHSIELGEAFYKLCVERFPLSETRAGLYESLQSVCGVLNEARIDGEIWLDGSFVTEKIDPNDIDFILILRSDFYDSSTATQRLVVESLADGELWKPPLKCDTNYVILDTVRPDAMAQPIRFWANRFGFSRTLRTPKGIFVIKIAGKEEGNEPSKSSESVTRSRLVNIPT